MSEEGKKFVVTEICAAAMDYLDKALVQVHNLENIYGEDVVLHRRSCDKRA